MLKKEIRIFTTAVMFFTRIPCPPQKDFHESDLNEASRYLGVVGIIVGALSFLVYWGAIQFLPVNVSVILAIAASVIITGAFHEDGFADSLDGFGGGWEKEKILEIMKDSRVGSFGVVGLILLFLLKVSLLSYLITVFNDTLIILGLFIGSHSISRSAAAMLMSFLEYAQADEASKVKALTDPMNGFSLNFLILTGSAPILFFLPVWEFFLALIPVFLVAAVCGRYYKKKIGGYTGDCLGATQQICELTFLIAIAAVFKIII